MQSRSGSLQRCPGAEVYSSNHRPWPRRLFIVLFEKGEIAKDGPDSIRGEPLRYEARVLWRTRGQQRHVPDVRTRRLETPSKWTSQQRGSQRMEYLIVARNRQKQHGRIVSEGRGRTDVQCKGLQHSRRVDDDAQSERHDRGIDVRRRDKRDVGRDASKLSRTERPAQAVDLCLETCVKQQRDEESAPGRHLDSERHSCRFEASFCTPGGLLRSFGLEQRQHRPGARDAVSSVRRGLVMRGRALGSTASFRGGERGSRALDVDLDAEFRDACEKTNARLLDVDEPSMDRDQHWIDWLPSRSWSQLAHGDVHRADEVLVLREERDLTFVGAKRDLLYLTGVEHSLRSHDLDSKRCRHRLLRPLAAAAPWRARRPSRPR